MQQLFQTVPVSPDLQRPPEQQGRAQGEGSPAVPAAWQVCCRGQASWDFLGDRKCQGAGANRLWMTLCRWFKAKLPTLVITQLCTTTCICYAVQLRTEMHYAKRLSRKTEERKYDFSLNLVLLTLLIEVYLWHSRSSCKIISATLKLFSELRGYPFAWLWKKEQWLKETANT